MTSLIFIVGFVVGFGYARFSDYMLKTKRWPYNK